MPVIGWAREGLADLVWLGSCGVVEKVLVELGAAGLVVCGGVVVLGLQGGSEGDGGLEEPASFADGLEGAVQVGGAGAPAVAEHAAVLGA